MKRRSSFPRSRYESLCSYNPKAYSLSILIKLRYINNKKFRNNIIELEDNEKSLIQTQSRLLRENEEMKKNNLVYVDKITYYKNMINQCLDKDKHVLESLFSIKQKYNSILIFFIKLKEVKF